MTVTLNGENKEVPDGLTVATLLAHLGMAGERVAIERNREVLPRSQWPATNVQAGDRYEVVHLVGGG